MKNVSNSFNGEKLLSYFSNLFSKNINTGIIPSSNKGFRKFYTVIELFLRYKCKSSVSNPFFSLSAASDISLNVILEVYDVVGL